MGTSSDFFDTLKGISEHMDLPQELKDMLPAFMDNTGTMISYGDLDSKSSQELKDMLGLPFIDEQPPGESIELDEELLGEEVVIWVLEKHNNDVVRDGEAMRVSGTLSEVNYHTTKVAGFGRREGRMSRPAPSIFLFNRSYRTMPTVHAVVVQANPGVPTRFCG